MKHSHKPDPQPILEVLSDTDRLAEHERLGHAAMRERASSPQGTPKTNWTPAFIRLGSAACIAAVAFLVLKQNDSVSADTSAGELVEQAVLENPVEMVFRAPAGVMESRDSVNLEGVRTVEVADVQSVLEAFTDLGLLAFADSTSGADILLWRGKPVLRIIENSDAPTEPLEISISVPSAEALEKIIVDRGVELGQSEDASASLQHPSGHSLKFYIP